MATPKILLLDIETAPTLAYVWRMWKENISSKQVKEHSFILSFAAKWLHENEMFYEENRTENDKQLVEQLIYLLDEADVVIVHYGKRFDLPVIKGRALMHGIKPPSPYKIIDTYYIAKREFALPYNSLDYLSSALNCNVKKKRHGFDLWKRCLEGDDEAWKEMEGYNIDDVLALEEIYLKMLPWVSNHPNLSVYKEVDEPMCPKCLSVQIQWRGYAYSNTSTFHRYQCLSCGGWGRTRFNIDKNNKKMLTNG